MKKLTKTIAGIIAISVMFKTTVLVASTQMDSTNSKEIEQELFTEKQHPEAYCLALNIYYESRSDNLAGMAAVSDVVLNRVESTVYPNTVCDVIKQAKMKESWKTKQFPDLDDSERKYIPIRNAWIQATNKGGLGTNYSLSNVRIQLPSWHFRRRYTLSCNLC